MYEAYGDDVVVVVDSFSRSESRGAVEIAEGWIRASTPCVVASEAGPSSIDDAVRGDDWRKTESNSERMSFLIR